MRVHNSSILRPGRPRFNEVLPALALALAVNVCAAGPWHASRDNTEGWRLMSPDERVEHQRRMRSFESYEQCMAYQQEHHRRMSERARRAGVAIEGKAESGCERLRARSAVK